MAEIVLLSSPENSADGMFMGVYLEEKLRQGKVASFAKILIMKVGEREAVR